MGRIVVAGATGFIGRALTEKLLALGHEVLAVSRDEGRVERLFARTVQPVPWDGLPGGRLDEAVEGSLAVINLAGEQLGAGRWSRSRKEKILTSRVNSASAAAGSVKRAKVKPLVYIQASAIGYYGSRGGQILSEDSPSGDGFLAEVVRRWEAASLPAEEAGVRRVLLRSGVVLGNGGGIFPKIRKAFSLFSGFVPGGGQWFSWIHIEDEVKAILFLMDRNDISGPVNAVSPAPLHMEDFFAETGRATGKPLWGRAPAAVVRGVLGEAAEETILASSRVLPNRLQRAGFEFIFPGAKEAVADLVSAGG